MCLPAPVITGWAVGLAAYALVQAAVYRELMSLPNWIVVGMLTLAVWLLAAGLVTRPVLRRLARPHARRPPSVAVLAAVAVALAIVPVWLTLGVWDGWHPRHLLSPEAPLLAVLYGTAGVVLARGERGRNPDRTTP